MRKKIVFLGNSLYLEDKIGLVIGEMLRDKLAQMGFDVEISEKINIGLLDILLVQSNEFDLMVIVDSVYVDNNQLYGEVFILDPEKIVSASIKAPHTISLRDIVELIRAIINKDIKIYVLGIGIRDLSTLSEDLSDYLKTRINLIADKILDLLKIIISRYT